ncbi:MAG: Sodium/hydrogen exchanger [Candidatus Woesebacteria bacterium GW2011_GWA1_40_43]|uniref:Sodium/hydrogen exchanger n=1 Tax=Candidatus Woesebacteria bacterium GW2011_GWA1_40_43 TaxID=1618553 RepID=A0A0G0SMA5_9BACT|nr:MAG: Sodium/hydrogen exchanger [Candidatus Woesebacteria bacterium GW2011_GWA1_40_43]
MGAILPPSLKSVSSLAQVGIILLLFSIGIELSFDRLSKYLKIAVFGSLIQITLTALFAYFILGFFNLSHVTAFILSLGFSVSSTAVVVKILEDKGELDTIHGGIIFGWLLVQDLAVIPMMVILPFLAGEGGNAAPGILLSLGKGALVILGVILLGKKLVPYIIHKLAGTNSREILLLASIALALGTAAITSFFGISPALGAFLAFLFGYRGRTAVANSFALAQVGEFAFVIFSEALLLKLLTPQETSIGISVVLLTLVISPILYNLVLPFWRKMKTLTAKSQSLSKLFSAGEKHTEESENLRDHIIICGYGRVGKWIGKAFQGFDIPFVVVEYNQSIISELKDSGIPALYGDPTEPEVLEAVGVRNSKAVILAIPDRVAQETLIAYVQTVSPGTKIISRAHQESDWEKLKNLQVDKVVQPEFEAALAIIRNVFSSMGKTKEEISAVTKSLRLSRSK